MGYGGDSSGGNEIAVCGTNLGNSAGATTTTTVTIGGVSATGPDDHIELEPVRDCSLGGQSSTAAVNVIVTNTLLTVSTTSTCSANPGCVYTYTWAPPTVTAVGLIPVTATSQTGSVVTVTAAGTWTAGQEVTSAGSPTT